MVIYMLIYFIVCIILIMMIIKLIKERNYYRNKATKDELTNTYNYYSYKEKINNSFNKYDNIVLAIIDIDNFKIINDTYGHCSGNVVLKRLGNVLNKINNKDTYVARYGGEEFVVLFFNENINNSYKIINELRIEFSNIKFEELDNNVTFSCGIAKQTKDLTPITLFEKADKALYEAKRSGKNRITVN